MKIKSLLLGSAATIVVVSGAQAADAVVIEPEPTEYLRVCDAYGSGFFFIPGTETCLRFSGYVRTHFSKLNKDTTATVRSSIIAGNYSLSEETTRWSTRARFDIDTRNETDWGTLRSLIRIQASDQTDDGQQLEVDQAFITIAGLRAGIGGSLFNANFAAGMNLEGVSQLFEDGVYGFSNSHILDYTFAFSDLTLSVGIEDRDGADASDTSFLGKIEYSADFGTIGFVGESQETAGEAYKVYTTLDLSEFVPGGIFGGFYGWQNTDPLSGATRRFENTFINDLYSSFFKDLLYDATVGLDNVWGVGFQMNLTDNVEFIAYHNATEFSGNLNQPNVGSANGELDSNLTTIGLNWYPISNLKVFGAYSFGSDEASDSFTSSDGEAEGSVSAERDFNQFLIGLRRNF